MRINALKHNTFVYFLLFLFLIILTFAAACRTSQPVELRGFAPADTLVYLEVNDLSKTLNALTENKTFQELTDHKKDFSALANVRAAVIVTGFQTSEKQITGESSVLNFQPHFVAVAETHAWEFQTVSLVENQIDTFVRQHYGENTNLEKSTGKDGRKFVWTAKDGRKVFAFVQKSLIFFGNDETAIEKCQAAERGEVESLLNNEALSRAVSTKAENNLAFGYVSPSGISEIADVTGVSAAIEATQSGEEKSFIARVLPQFVRNTTEEIFWTTQQTGQKIEDKFFISLTPAAASIVRDNLTPPPDIKFDAVEFIPDDVFSATVYNLKEPLAAWRSLLILATKNADPAAGKLLVSVSGSLLEPYGISDAETFLSAVGSDILTARFDTDGENSVSVFTVKDAEKLKKSIGEINFKTVPGKYENAEIWESKDQTLTAAFVQNKLILGDAESVLKCLLTKQSGKFFTGFPASSAVSATYTKDSDTSQKVVAILGDVPENKIFVTFYTTENSLRENGVERKTFSDFGLLGTILEYLTERD